MSVENINILVADSQRKNFKEYNTLCNKLESLPERDTKTALKGFVQVHENIEGKEKPELISESNNLITYSGRSMMLARAVGRDLNHLAVNPNTFPYKGMKDKFVAFFAIGSGGAASENNQNPLVVNSTDYELGAHGTLTGASKLVVVNGRQYMGFDDDYPRFVVEPEIVNTDEIYTAMRSQIYDGYKRDSYLITKFQITLNASTANASGSQEISEAGLFLAESDNTNDSGSWWNDNAYNAGFHLEMFARTTFPTITKNSNRSFTLSWYLFF